MRTDNPLGELNNVEREKNNKDITLKFDKLTIHIENKVKSLPQQRQLDDYNKDLKNKNEVLVLLSLFPYKGHVPFISYQQIAKWLDKINIEPENKPENGEDLKVYYIIKDYVQFVTRLVKLYEIVFEEKDVIFNFSSKSTIYTKLHKIRLHDIYHKIKYHKLRLKIEELVRDKIVDLPEGLFQTSDYFSRGTGAANFTINIENKPKRYFEIQFQDNMLRLMLFSSNCVDQQEDIAGQPFFEEYFGLIKSNDTLFNSPTMRKEFNKYGNYIIYKYVTVKEGCDLEELRGFISDLIIRVIKNTSENEGLLNVFLDKPSGFEGEIEWKD